MRFESKKEMAQALLDGRRFRNYNGIDIYFDPSYFVPFRYGDDSMVGAWNMLGVEWTEILPWYENIPEHGVLCWVWDDDESECEPKVIITHRNNKRMPFETSETYWENARPLTPEEAQQYIYQEPEK